MLHFVFYWGKKDTNRIGEMAEWSNAVDSKSIVRFVAYLGFESLSHRHLQQPRYIAGFCCKCCGESGFEPQREGEDKNNIKRLFYRTGGVLFMSKENGY